MKKDFYVIKKLNYDLLLNGSVESQEFRRELIQMVSDHKMMLKIQEVLIQQQESCVENIFGIKDEHIETRKLENPADEYKSNEDECPVDAGSAESSTSSNPIKPTKKKNSGKRSLSPDIQKHHQLSDDEKICNLCGSHMATQQEKWRTLVISKPIFTTEKHIIETCRCLTCGFTRDAKTPVELSQNIGRYHYSAVANIVALRYQYGMASCRLEGYSANVGLKISDSTQWHLFEQAASEVRPFFIFLNEKAASAPTHHIDDTNILILETARQIEKEQEAAAENGANPDSVRSGIHTTNVTTVSEEGEIVLFHTGLHHAGETLVKLLKKRTTEEEVIIMSDAASSNTSKLKNCKANAKVANCNSHAFRKFKDIAEAEKEFAKKLGIKDPTPSKQLDFFLNKYRTLFENDKKTRNMTASERLQFHKTNSEPVMASLLAQIESDFRLKNVEPNSDLGKSYAYFKKHYPELSAFCRLEGAPICNNLSERMLKGIIRHRKNSLFFKNQLGAAVADIFTSILFTAHANGINSIEYLTNLLIHKNLWRENPDAWLPWNYKATIAAIESTSAAD